MSDKGLPDELSLVFNKIKRARQVDTKPGNRPGATVPTVPKKPRQPRVLKAVKEEPSKEKDAHVDTPPAPEPEDRDVLEVLMSKAVVDRSSTKPSEDTGMAMLQAIAYQIQTGKPIKDIEGVVIPHLGEMSSKIHLWRSASAYHNMFERGALYAQARWTLEKSLWDDLMNSKLSPGEKLELLTLSIKENDKIQAGLGSYQAGLEDVGRGTTADIEGAAERADRTLIKVDDPTKKHLDGTSSTGRELARRILDSAGKNADKIVAEALKSKSTH